MNRRTATAMSLCALLLGIAPAARAFGFGPGERLDFDVSYLGLGSGKAALRIDPAVGEGARVWPIVFEGGARAPFGLFKVKERVTSMWDTSARATVEYSTVSESSSSQSRSHALLDLPGMKFEVVRNRNGTESKMTVPVETSVQDLASMVMFLRTKPLGLGDAEEFPVFTGKKVIQMLARVVKRERIKTDAGSFNAVKVRATLVSETNRELIFWFSDDARHLPLKLEADLAIGSMVATLTRYTP